MGDIGGAGRFEFAVIGDTVNVASRLEQLTRSLDQPILASEAVIRAAGPVGAQRYIRLGERVLRGRDEATTVWGVKVQPAVAVPAPATG